MRCVRRDIRYVFEDIRYIDYRYVPDVSPGLSCGNVDIRYIRYIRYALEVQGRDRVPVDNPPDVTLCDVPDVPSEIPDVSEKYRMSLSVRDVRNMSIYRHFFNKYIYIYIGLATLRREFCPLSTPPAPHPRPPRSTRYRMYRMYRMSPRHQRNVTGPRSAHSTAKGRCPMPENTAQNDPWGSLSDEERYCRPFHQPRTPGPQKPPQPFHTRPLPEWPDTRQPVLECDPHCLACQRAETYCRCARKPTICDHTRPVTNPHTGNPIPNPIHVCILLGPHAPAILRTGTGRSSLLAVPHCPHCQRAHRHTSHPNAHPYRISSCGKPYLLETR